MDIGTDHVQRIEGHRTASLPLITRPLGLVPERISPSYRPIELSANRIRTWLRQSHGTRIDTICISAVLLLANPTKKSQPPEGSVPISFRRVPMRLATAVIATVYLLPPPSTRLLSLQALAADTTSFTRQVSPRSETNATEPSVAVDRSDGTEGVAWQASGTHVARSDDGGHTFVQTPISNLFGSDVGDVDIRIGGPTRCSVVTSSCSPGTHRVY